MSHSILAPVFTGLRIGLHTLLLGLAVLTVVRGYVVSSSAAVGILVLGSGFVGVYFVGSLVARTRGGGVFAGRVLVLGWVMVLTFLWALLVWLSPEGAYLVFPLFFLYLHVLSGVAGVVTVAVTTVFAIVALGVHQGFSVGGVIGPLVGAGVALLVGLAYRTLTREVAERERLLGELLSARQQLAETEREQGALMERARLARDIHDTVAQGLSSIQMLLRAAERDAPEPGAGYVRLARETAAESLADIRQIIRELTPARLDEGLQAALGRLAREQTARSSTLVTVKADDVTLSMSSQIALLRIAQGALSNALQHARAERVVIELTATGTGVVLAVRDNGRGYDVSRVSGVSHVAGSFGLQAMRERVDQLEGTLTVSSVPGRGTCVCACLPFRRSDGSSV